MRKKAITLLITLAMIMVSIPMELFAAETVDNGNEQTVPEQAELAETVDSETITNLKAEYNSGNKGLDISWGYAGTTQDPGFLVYCNDTLVTNPQYTDKEYSFSNLTSGNAYTIVVQAVDSSGTAIGNPASAYVDFETITSVTNKSVGSATVSWNVTEATKNDTFKLWYTNNGATKSVEVTPGEPKAQSVEIKGLQPGACTFVLDRISGGKTFSGTKYDAYVHPQYTDAVRNLKIKASYKSVVVSWSAPASGADSYYVVKYDSNGEKQWAKTVSSKKLTDTVSVCKTYKYRVYAKKEGVFSKYVEIKGAAVRPVYYRITFKQTKALTSHAGGKKTTTFKKGFTVDAYGFVSGQYRFKYKGRTYYVNAIRTTNQKIVSLKPNLEYTAAEAELFVNKKGLKSSTKYLIWVNTCTQHLYIFKGKKGNWDCIKHWEIATGLARTPTPSITTSIKSKEPINHGLRYWSLCSTFSIHGKASSWKVGKPASSGCVRNTNDHAYWIYTNCPKYTTVAIY